MITYPLPVPTHTGHVSVRITARSTVALSTSPFTGSQQVQEYAGQWLEMEIVLPPMRQADAALWIAFFLKLNGAAGTFLMGETNHSNRGTCITATVNGAHTARAKELSLNNMTVGGTIKAGDYIQLGTGLTSRLHKVLNDVTADGSDEAVLDIYPALRTDYSDAAATVLVNPVGLFRLASNEMPYEVSAGIVYGGMTFAAREAI